MNHIVSRAKIRALDRRSFGSILRRLCRHLDVPVTQEDLQRFIASRNQLVHEGRFTWQTARPESGIPSPTGPAAEYRFLVNFLDRIYLKLLGYSGRYIDWSQDPPGRVGLRSGSAGTGGPQTAGGRGGGQGRGGGDVEGCGVDRWRSHSGS